MILGPTSGDLDDDAVAAAYPWPAEGPWVRAMMVTTLDGAAAGPDGTSDSISSSVDKAVFDAVRRFADAVVVGAGTIRAEGYGAMRAKPADVARRTAAGQAAAPVVVVVSGSLDLPWDSELFTASTERPIVVAGAGATAAARAAAAAHCDLVVAPDERVGPGFVVDTLVARGLRRIVCEGGPSLLERFVADGRLDEADITVSPAFAGLTERPGSARDVVRHFELAHVIHAEGFLMNRYLAPGSGR
ncbi:dihydrofolate reductase family protein [Nocardioides sp. 1609]|uniref:dihydrofolate reductase family protein n=1 Tax=Nocardioides sp. 1609 TaxID=2508327 RepID=UPI00106F9801|nr:dihydrofolate reductase family protein [Nocardioides sp. 1609]